MIRRLKKLVFLKLKNGENLQFCFCQRKFLSKCQLELFCCHQDENFYFKFPFLSNINHTPSILFIRKQIQKKVVTNIRKRKLIINILNYL